MKHARQSPLPLGRGREAMTCDRVHLAIRERAFHGAVASHLAELVRGESVDGKAPSSAPSGPLLPKGRRAAVACEGAEKETRT